MSSLKHGPLHEPPFDHGLERTAILVAIPCFNEERYIGSVVIKAKQYADSVVVVDDGSSDASADVARKAGAIVIVHDCNQGKAAAANTAFDYARKNGGSALVLLDGDGQHEPADIPALLEPILAGSADIVVGSRYLQVKTHIPRLRALGQRVLTFVTNLGTRIKLTDTQSGFRAFSPRAIHVLSFRKQGFSLESEMQFLAQESGLTMAEVPVNIEYYDRAKRNPFTHGTAVLRSILGLISQRIPFFFFGIPGAVMLSVGIMEGWRVIRVYNDIGDFYVGPALLAVLLCTIGILSLYTGLILHTIKSFFK